MNFTKFLLLVSVFVSASAQADGTDVALSNPRFRPAGRHVSFCESAQIGGEIQAVERLELSVGDELGTLQLPASAQKTRATYLEVRSTRHAAYFWAIESTHAITPNLPYAVTGFFVFDSGSLVVQFEDPNGQLWNQHFHCQAD